MRSFVVVFLTLSAPKMLVSDGDKDEVYKWKQEKHKNDNEMLGSERDASNPCSPNESTHEEKEERDGKTYDICSASILAYPHQISSHIPSPKPHSLGVKTLPSHAAQLCTIASNHA